MKEYRKRPPQRDAEADGVIEGRNAVIEALRAGTAIDKIYLAKGDNDSALGHIANTARANGVVVVNADRRKLDEMSRTHAHQGVIAVAAVRAYASIEDIFQRAEERGEAPLIVLCDELSDPHNLGAVIRTAECAGAHGVVIPKRRSAGLTAIVAKTSAGAVSHIPVAQPDGADEGAAKAGRVDLRRGDEREHVPVRSGLEGSGRHRHRQRGQRHEPFGGRDLRFYCQYPHEGEDQFPERLGCGGHPAL